MTRLPGNLKERFREPHRPAGPTLGARFSQGRIRHFIISQDTGAARSDLGILPPSPLPLSPASLCFSLASPLGTLSGLRAGALGAQGPATHGSHTGRPIPPSHLGLGVPAVDQALALTQFFPQSPLTTPGIGMHPLPRDTLK